jgi:bifunctional enzyme CysN/CysC
MTVSDQTEKAEKVLHPKGVTRQLLRITTAGSVDDGKSTLIGRIMHDTDSLPLDHLEAVTDEEGVADLAALSDGLRAEREQGITIDVAYRFFSTEKRSYIHPQHVHWRLQRTCGDPAGRCQCGRAEADAQACTDRKTVGHQALCGRSE